MSNYWGRLNAPMKQPTKDQLRQELSIQKGLRAAERLQREAAEKKVRQLEQGIRHLAELQPYPTDGRGESEPVG